MDAPDPLLALEHDHVHLSRLVAELRQMMTDVAHNDPRSDLQEEVCSTLAALRDDLFAHFAREEEALFPYLGEAFPELRPTIERLEGAHDRICGGISRILVIAEKGDAALREQRALAAQLFARFDAEYGEHARHESDFLRNLGPHLDRDRREHVRQILATF
ncbi:MAG: hemerythrin domain-containing protein [Deltaproteobacteria bacterium]|nr:hemerythrin domain-containing protein [Deltaproteobacteria bacterium]